MRRGFWISRHPPRRSRCRWRCLPASSAAAKTSFLRRVLADPEASDTAVLINEFGEVGLDHLMVEATRPGDVVQLPSGCMCCAVKQDLALALHRLLRSRADGTLPPFRRVAIETSGLAEPAPILYTLAAEAYLEHMLRCDRVVTVVDAVLGEATIERFAEATAQAVCADLLLISKTDLQPASAELLQQLQSLNPWAEIAESAAPNRQRRRCLRRRQHRASSDGGPPRRTVTASPRMHWSCTVNDPVGIRRGVGWSGARARRGSAACQGVRRIRRQTWPAG